jgi:4-hydroxyacetophenone monooxygenase
MTATDDPDTTSLPDVSTEMLRRIIKDAYLPALLTTLAHLTGDWSLVDDEYRSGGPITNLGLDPTGGMSAATRAKASEHALTVLLKYRDGGYPQPPPPTRADLLRLMQFSTGPVSAEYGPLLAHELGLPVDNGAPRWTLSEVAPGRTFRVAVIGAGMSGLVAAHRLGQAGIPYVVFERNPDVGGVWFANNYPGARLDTSNLTYSYSFDQRTWDDQYSKRDDVLEYFRAIADDHGIAPNIRFRTAVTDGEFDSGSGTWTLRVRNPDGSTEQLAFEAVVSAVGQLSEPNVPDIPGRDSFAGPAWHMARWNHEADLAGQRITLTGTGASAFQVVPEVAAKAAHLTIFQRTPAWVLPTPGYTSQLPAGQRWLLRNLPHYNRWLRFHTFWIQVEGIRHLAVVDPQWRHPVSVSAQNEAMRASLETFIRTTFADRPDLADKLVPAYPPYAKRTVRDDGTWTTALRRPNVSLETTAIERITPRGILTADGTLHEADVIVFGTGFKASDFLSSLSLRGPDGVTLSEAWNGDARAYYGISVPGFPNLFCLYGPNTNLNVNGSTVLFSEAGVEHILSCIKSLLTSGHRAMTVRRDVLEGFNARIDAACLTLAVGVATVNTWYKNKFGRVSQNWPLSTLEYWEGTRRPAEEDYDYL